MNNWNDTDQSRAHDKWAKWTVKPQRKSDFSIKHVSALVFVLTATAQLPGVVG